MKNRLLNPTRWSALAAMLTMTALTAVALALTSLPVSAQITFTLDDVNLVQGTYAAGTLTGTFELNSALTQVLSYNLVASASPGSPGHTFAGATYDLSDSSVVFDGLGQASPNFEIEFTSGPDQTSLVFTNLTTSGGTLSTSSYESENDSGGNRTVAAGSTVATPEPSAWALSLVAALGIGLIRLIPRRPSLLSAGPS